MTSLSNEEKDEKLDSNGGETKTGPGDGARPQEIHRSEWEIDCMTWRGKILTGKYAHWCLDWDELPVDETCMEWEACTCFDSSPPRR